MEFNILGTLRFTRTTGERITPRGKKMELLAVLLLRTNEILYIDQIVEYLWDGSPPASAVRNIRTYAWQLRKDLGADADRLVGHGGGYSLKCGEDELDLIAFQRQARSGREYREAGDLESAAASFRAALSLWQGSPLGGAGLSLYLSNEANWLEEQRMSAVENLVETELSRGRHHEVIERIGREISRYPLRESLYACMMRALCGCGRQSDALAMYRRARTALRTEAGIDPGSPLRNLHEDILAGAY
ncbi:transcriptional regulator, SARP family [Actinobacteria bacterium OK074]|nr:transcriptional regulator, SARP family [Actinobacteria bacterium OK074]